MTHFKFPELDNLKYNAIGCSVPAKKSGDTSKKTIQKNTFDNVIFEW